MSRTISIETKLTDCERNKYNEMKQNYNYEMIYGSWEGFGYLCVANNNNSNNSNIIINKEEDGKNILIFQAIQI